MHRRRSNSARSSTRWARSSENIAGSSTTQLGSAGDFKLLHRFRYLYGTSIRIPVQNVSIVSLDVNLAKAATKDDINAAMQDAAKGELRGVLDYNTLPLVGSDFNHTSPSCTFDATPTPVVYGARPRGLGWAESVGGFP